MSVIHMLQMCHAYQLILAMFVSMLASYRVTGDRDGEDEANSSQIQWREGASCAISYQVS